MLAATRIDDYREQIELRTADGDTHCIPISVFQHVVAGKLTVNKISDFIPIYQEITRQWLQMRKGGA